MGGLNDPDTYGYWCGGNNTTTTDRLTYSNSVTAANTDSDLTVSTSAPMGSSDGTSFGYVAGGYAGAFATKTERMTYSTGVFATHTDADLSVGRQSGGSYSDGVL